MSGLGSERGTPIRWNSPKRRAGARASAAGPSSSARAWRTPGFASPPLDGFAFFGTAPGAAAPGILQDVDQTTRTRLRAQSCVMASRYKTGEERRRWQVGIANRTGLCRLRWEKRNGSGQGRPRRATACYPRLVLATEVIAQGQTKPGIAAGQAERDINAGANRDVLVQHQANAELRQGIALRGGAERNVIRVLGRHMAVRVRQAGGRNDLHPGVGTQNGAEVEAHRRIPEGL